MVPERWVFARLKCGERCRDVRERGGVLRPARACACACAAGWWSNGPLKQRRTVCGARRQHHHRADGSQPDGPSRRRSPPHDRPRRRRPGHVQGVFDCGSRAHGKEALQPFAKGFFQEVFSLSGGLRHHLPCPLPPPLEGKSAFQGHFTSLLLHFNDVTQLGFSPEILQRVPASKPNWK